MRNIFILYMPPGNAEAMVHYEETIRQKIPLERIADCLDEKLLRRLKNIFGSRPIAIWGSRDSVQNRAKFERMQDGDEVLIVEGATVKLQGRVAAKVISPSLSAALWKNLRGERTDGWNLIYFIANPREVDVPFDTVRDLLGYEPNFQLRGFTAVSPERLAAFYSAYDDLYSILMARQAGEPVRRIAEEARATAESVPKPHPTESELAAPDVNTVSDHLWMQWTLLKFGKKAGQKVWAPRSDQSRIKSLHSFSEFEPTFAAGLDTQVKYVENIDVVWKEEFRIDAAFEVENSTAIYSGLLRFSDLTMVAPNTQYPLFIVAPNERRNRVREQLARPTFKHLKIAEKVRFLSYEKVREIDEFFESADEGVSVGVFTGKSERLAAG